MKQNNNDNDNISLRINFDFFAHKLIILKKQFGSLILKGSFKKMKQLLSSRFQTANKR